MRDVDGELFHHIRVVGGYRLFSVPVHESPSGLAWAITYVNNGHRVYTVRGHPSSISVGDSARPV